MVATLLGLSNMNGRPVQAPAHPDTPNGQPSRTESAKRMASTDRNQFVD